MISGYVTYLSSVLAAIAFGAVSLAHAETQTYLGVATVPANSEAAEHLQLERGSGLTVQFVDPEGAAAGVLRPLDILYKLDEQILVDPRQLSVLVRSRQPGDELLLTLFRKGERLEQKVVLGEREGVPQLASPPAAVPALPAMPPARGFGRGGSIDGMERELREQLDRFQQNFGAMDDLLEELRSRMHARPPQAGSGQVIQQSSSSVSISRIENGMRMSYSNHNGDQRLKVEDENGNTIFDGPINTQEELEKVPAEAAEFLDSIDVEIESESGDEVDLIPVDAI
jgi:hypothetical protein